MPTRPSEGSMVRSRPAAPAHLHLVGASLMLSSRELEVLQLASLGHPGKRIARELCISPQTVKHHLSHASRKLGANSRTHAVAQALRAGWIR